MRRERIALPMLLAVAALAGGCGTGQEAIKSGQFLCVDDTDCTWGWTCSKSGGQGVCVNPADQDGGTVPAVDSSPQPLIDAGPVVTPDSGLITCVPNQQECVDLGSYRTCNAAGTGFSAATSCPALQRCESGTCQSAGKVTGQILASVNVQAKDIILDIDPGKYKLSYHLSADFRYDAPGLVAPSAVGPEGCTQLNVGSSATSNPGVGFDVGPVTFTGAPVGSYSLTFDAAKQQYTSSQPLGHSDLDQFPFGGQLSFAAPGGGLVHVALAGDLPLPPLRLLTKPGPQEKLALAKNQPLPLSWSGATGKGQVTVQLVCLPATLPPGTYVPPIQVRCAMDDDGSFTVPANIMSLFNAYPKVAIYLFHETQAPLTASGLSEGETRVRYSYQPAFPIELQ